MRALARLMRAGVSCTSRPSSALRSFATSGLEGALAGIPIEVIYQPHWWLRIEMSLDDSVDVPLDPANDHPLLRISVGV